MKLFLASQDFGAHAEKLVEMVGENRRVLFSKNAEDGMDAGERAAKVEEKRGMFEGMGFEFLELDLRDYFGKIDELDKFVREWKPGLVWCGGGNTFVLRKALSYSGMDEVLGRDVRRGKYVYGGSSAGAIVAGPSLAHFEVGDDPYVCLPGYANELIWEGMGLTGERVVPHADTDWYGEVAASRAEVFSRLGLAHVVLNDSDVLIVEGERREVLR